MHKFDVLAQARRVVAMEVQAISRMADRFGADFEAAVQLVMASTGRVIIIGMGKSGHIGRKIAATMSSTGTSSFFVHPGEAFHGDLGMIRPEDVALMISNSGETDELVRLLPFLEQQGNAVIAMTGKPLSTLGRGADVVLDIGVEVEACSNNLAPTSSTTATLVMGDALAVTLSAMKGFKPEDFARFHPGGSLGRRLLTRVSDVMHRDHLPFCAPEASFREVVQAITRGRLGLVLIGRPDGLCGIVTDGDVRRAFESHANPLVLRADEFMSGAPQVIVDTERLGRAEDMMRERRIHALIATDERGLVSGVVQLLTTEPAAAATSLVLSISADGTRADGMGIPSTAAEVHGV